MSDNYTDIYMARKKMRLKNRNVCLSFVNTVWKGEVIMCCFNNTSDCISDIFCSQELDLEETKILEKLIKEFLNAC